MTFNHVPGDVTEDANDNPGETSDDGLTADAPVEPVDPGLEPEPDEDDPSVQEQGVTKDKEV